MNIRLRRVSVNNKSLLTSLVILLLTVMSLGFAYMESKVNVNGNIILATKGGWDVHFENVNLSSGSVNTSSPVISDDQKSVSFSVNLTDIEQYYEFTIDVVNNGSIDAMLGDIIIKGIPTSLEGILEYKLTYSDGIKLSKYGYLKVDTTETLKLKVNFNRRFISDSIKENFTLTLEVPYVQSTNEAVDRAKPIILKEAILNQNNPMSDFEIDFTRYSSDTNGKGLYVYSNTVDNEYPIYYYRGAVTTNNIIFGNFCWKIVRTTETGGTKLIYNGVPNNNTCNNTGVNAQLLSSSVFNEVSNSVKYLGFMYDNTSSSTIKNVLEKWYENNLKDNYESYLEDTIWCVDRSLPSVSGNTTYYGSTTRTYVDKEKPLIICPQKDDSYTLKNKGYKNGNELLNYSIGLLTADEAILGGFGHYNHNSSYNTTTYLYTGYNYWLLSPSFWDGTNSAVVYVNGSGTLFGSNVTTSYGIRPSVSLAREVNVTTNGSGEVGSVNNPYIVVEN